MDRIGKPMPCWIWHERLEAAPRVKLTREIQLKQDEPGLVLHLSLTGGAILEWDQQEFGRLPESAENVCKLTAFPIPPGGTGVGQHQLTIHIACTKPMPVAPIGIHLKDSRVGCLAFLQGAELVTVSDESWMTGDQQARVVCRYGEEPYGDLTDTPEWFASGGFGDLMASRIEIARLQQVTNTDCRIENGALQLAGLGSRDLPIARKAAEDLHLFYHLRKQKEWKELREEAARHDLSTCPSVRLDLGREYNARFRLSNKGCEPIRMLWHGAESLYELEHYDGCITELLAVEAGEVAYSLPQGLRYVQLYVLGARGKQVRLTLEVEHVGADPGRVGVFESDCEQLDRIYETSAHTSLVCHQIGLWDGIKRDRLNWGYDFYLAGKADFVLWNDLSVLKRSILELGVGTPYGYWVNSLPSYTLWWLVGLWEYYLHTGDSSFVIKLREDIQRHCDWVAANLESGSFKPGIRSLIEWVEMSEAEERLCLHALLKIAKQSLTKLNGYLPELKLRIDWRLSELGLDGTPYQQNDHLITKLLAIKAGFVQEREIDRLLDDVKVVDPITPLSAFWLAECLAERGRLQQAANVIETVWGRMLDEGATTFWESVTLKPDAGANFHDSLTTYTNYRSYRISLCHSWASTPAQWIVRFVAGIEPIEPGYRVARVRPQALAGLTRGHCRIGTPQGPLAVRWETREGGIRASVEAPPGIRVFEDVEPATEALSPILE